MNSAAGPDVAGVFRARLLHALDDDNAPPVAYDELVREFGFQSPAQAGNILMTAKRVFSRCLEETVAQYALSADEVPR